MAQLDHIKSSVDGSIIVRICQIPLVVIGIGVAIFFDAPLLAIAGVFGIAAMTLSSFAGSRRYSLLVRTAWPIMADLALIIGSVAVHPSGLIWILFFHRATDSLVTFSSKDPVVLKWFLAIYPFFILLGFWAVDFQVLETFEVGEDIARTYIAPLCILGMFIGLLMDFHFFQKSHLGSLAAIKKAKQASDQANAAKSRFLKSLTHEMRTPMHTIIGYGELIRDDRSALVTDVSKAHMGQVLHSAEEMLAMVERGIRYAALSSEGIEAEVTDVDVTEIFDRLVVELRPQAREKGVSLIVIPSRGTSVKADPELLRDAVKQLIENAIKFCPTGCRIELEQDQIGARVEIAIRDNGPGFPDGFEEQAFEPFERLEQAMGTSLGGGIGLSMVRAQVQAMRGLVSIDATVSQGARVLIELPNAGAGQIAKLPLRNQRAATGS